MMNRRNFIRKTGGMVAVSGLLGISSSCRNMLREEKALESNIEIPQDLFFNISLAEWSLHKSIWSGAIDHLDFSRIAKESFGLQGVEYVNQFFMDKAEDISYLSDMKTRAEDHGVKSLMIMIDMEGSLGILDEKKRNQAVENHYKWIEAAHFLGCHSIRVNAAGKGARQSVADAVTDSLGQLCEYAGNSNLNVIVENHGGYSSDADWLTGVMEQVDLINCGVLPDLDNFTISLFPPIHGDPYDGVRKLLPYAKGISAKSHDFNNTGKEKSIDYDRMLQIIHDHGFKGFVGIEYEGYKLSEFAGIIATKNLLINSGLKSTTT